MPVLHLVITANEQILEIPTNLHAQSLTLRKAILVRKINPNAPNGPANLALDLVNNGGVINVSLEFLRGYETLCNEIKKYNRVSIADTPASDLLYGRSPWAYLDGGGVQQSQVLHTYLTSNVQYFNQTFLSEEIREKFKVDVFRNNGTDRVTFGGENSIEQIDLFFEYTEAYDYDNY